jgi:ankyrin repeat protein
VRLATIIGVLTLTALSADANDSLGESLIDAVRKGDVAQTQTLVEQWRATGKPFPLGPDDKPLLFLAIEGTEKTHPEIVEFLLDNGADVQTKGPMGMTALHWATSHGYAQRTEQILQHHPQIEATDDFGRTPLLVAHSLAAEKLLAAHANWMALDKFGNSSLHLAAERDAKHLELLSRAGFTVIDARNNAGLTPLHFAVLSGETSSARWLLDHGANPNAVTAAPYDYLYFDFYPGYGNEYHVPAGISVAGIAVTRDEETKWSSGHYRRVKDLLAARGIKAPWRPSAVLMVFFALMMAVFFITFMTAIFFLDARMTGWRALAQRFPATSEPPNLSKHQNGGVGTIGLVQLRGLLRAAATDQGLYLAFPKMLSAGHPPLLIPWSQLRITGDKTIFNMHVLTMQAGDPKIARVMLRGGIAPEVAARLTTTAT